jgi:predicted RecB family nuclease
MTEGIDTKRQNEYEPDVTPGELAADFSADPEIHGHHHLEYLQIESDTKANEKSCGDEFLNTFENLKRRYLVRGHRK